MIEVSKQYPQGSGTRPVDASVCFACIPDRPTVYHYCQPGKLAASPWVINSTATAAMSSPMIWVKTRIPVGPSRVPMISASRSTTQVLTAATPMMAQRST